MFLIGAEALLCFSVLPALVLLHYSQWMLTAVALGICTKSLTLCDLTSLKLILCWCLTKFKASNNLCVCVSYM